MKVHRTTLQLRRGSVKVHRRTLQLRRGSVRIYRRALQLRRASVKIHRSTLQLRRGSVKVHRGSLQGTRGSVKVHRGSFPGAGACSGLRGRSLHRTPAGERCRARCGAEASRQPDLRVPSVSGACGPESIAKTRNGQTIRPAREAARSGDILVAVETRRRRSHYPGEAGARRREARPLRESAASRMVITATRMSPLVCPAWALTNNMKR